MWRLTTHSRDVSAFPCSAKGLPVNEVFLQYPFIRTLYERGMPLWAGACLVGCCLGWGFHHRGKHLTDGLRTARDLLANGKLPMTVAPEGGTNGHSEIVSPLEPGVAQLGFCA